MRAIRVVAAAVLMAAAVAGCAASAGVTDSTPPAQIVATVCTRCHPVDRIKAANHDATAWKATIDRMRGKGAQLSDAQEAKVVDFLAGGGASSL